MDAQNKEADAEQKLGTTLNHMTDSIKGSVELIEHLANKLTENDLILIGMEFRNQYLAGYSRRQEEQRAAHLAFQKELSDGLAHIKASLKEMEGQGN